MIDVEVAVRTREQDAVRAHRLPGAHAAGESRRVARDCSEHAAGRRACQEHEARDNSWSLHLARKCRARAGLRARERQPLGPTASPLRRSTYFVQDLPSTDSSANLRNNEIRRHRQAPLTLAANGLAYGGGPGRQETHSR